jgi:PAS domain S-box-containing protein
MTEPKRRDRANESANGDMTSAPINAELRDVNERLLVAGLREQELADQLRRQLAFNNAITDILGEGICALDADCQVTFINPAAAHLLGRSEEELLGQDFHDAVHVHGPNSCQLHDDLRVGKASRYDDVFVRQDGTSYPVAYSVAPIITDGQADGTVVAFRDITERTRLEEAQTRLIAQEQASRSEAESAVRIRSEVLVAVSHDLRQPLTVIKGTAQILSRQVANLDVPERARLLDRLEWIDRSATMMAGIIEELLDVAQLAAGQRLALEQRPTDLVALIRRIVVDHDRTTAHHLVLEAAEEPLIGDWDAERLQRVFANLLSNATKYSPDDRNVIVRLGRDRTAPDWAVVEIKDEGIGIPLEDLSHIFDRYYRGSNAAGKTTGTGLGLAGSKTIIELHGGTISLTSAEGTGTTVTVCLPSVEQPPLESASSAMGGG